MKPIASHFHSDASRPHRWAVILLCVAFAFWPVFLTLTVLEERAGMSWLRTENPNIWLPVVAFALLSAVAAPFLLALSVPKKIVASLSSFVCFLLIYWLVVVVGVSFFRWDD